MARDRLHKAQASIVCFSCAPALHNIFHTPVARYSLFVLKVPLNTNQLFDIKLYSLIINVSKNVFSV